MNPAIELSNLNFSYGNQIGIRDLSLQIKRGEIFGFLGENGAGKTTTIRCLMNILVPQEGEIFINGEAISRSDPSYKEEIGYLPGELSIPGNYFVEDFFNYISALRNKAPTRLNEFIDRFSIPLNRRIKHLSKGNRQKVGIALAFMHDPQIFILDEPSSGLDPVLQQEFYSILMEEKKRGKTIFFSSHNLDEVQRICDRVAIIRQGSLVAVEDVGELSKDLRRRLIAKVSSIDEELLENYEYSIDLRTKQVTITVENSLALNDILDILRKFGLLDFNYPPASLENYFLDKYRS